MILSRRSPDGTVVDVSPEWMSVRSRVQEYGGGAWTVRDGIVLAVDFTTQQLWRLDGEPRALTPAVADAGVRWSAMEIDPSRGVCFAVREDHREEGLRAAERAGPASTRRRRAGPRHRGRPRTPAKHAPSRGGRLRRPGSARLRDGPGALPDRGRLAWVQWSHPSMPWDEASVHVGELDDSGDLHAVRRVGGGDGCTAFEPVWVDDQRLAFLTDPDGWSVPHLVDVPATRTVALADPGSEYGNPAWVPRVRSMTRTPDGRLVAVRHVDGLGRLTVLDRTGRVTRPTWPSRSSRPAACRPPATASSARPGTPSSATRR